MNFDEAFDKTVLFWEGGNVLHTVPGDPGGTTRWGIAQRYHPDVDILSMTEEDARDFYRERFWNAVRAERLPAEIRWDVFDYAVNRHPTTAVRTLQQAVCMCNLARGRPMIQVDGRLGPETLQSVFDLPPDRLIHVFRAYRTRYYLDRAETRHSQAKFLEGWLDRVDGKRGNV